MKYNSKHGKVCVYLTDIYYSSVLLIIALKLLFLKSFDHTCIPAKVNSRETFSIMIVHYRSLGTDVLAKKPLTVDNLILLHNLIQFENLMPRFTATVPSCWTEIQQEQQQRRHPQHLQHQGEATQHTRTWKLQPDRSVLKSEDCKVV